MNIQAMAAKSAGFLMTAAWIGAAIAAPLPPSRQEAVDISAASPGAAGVIRVPPAGDRSFRPGQIIVSLPSGLSLEAIDALVRRHRLTRVESQSIGLLGRTIHRWRIADGRSVPDVILELERDGGIEAQPNNVFTLQ